MNNQDIRNISHHWENYICDKYNLKFINDKYDAVDDDGNKIEIKSCLEYYRTGNTIRTGRFHFKSTEKNMDLKYFFIVYDEHMNIKYEWILTSQQIRKHFKLNHNDQKFSWKKLLRIIR